MASLWFHCSREELQFNKNCPEQPGTACLTVLQSTASLLEEKVNPAPVSCRKQLPKWHTIALIRLLSARTGHNRYKSDWLPQRELYSLWWQHVPGTNYMEVIYRSNAWPSITVWAVHCYPQTVRENLVKVLEGVTQALCGRSNKTFFFLVILSQTPR